MDGYTTTTAHGNFPERRKRKSVLPTSVLDNLSSRKNLPILSLKDIERVVPQSTQNLSRIRAKQTKLPSVFLSPNVSQQAPAGARHSGGRNYI